MKKILVIDDEKPTLSMFRLFLGAYGYTVLTAENAAEGIRLFREASPDIVFTDIKMPGKDGIYVLETLKKINPAAQIIVMTGHGDHNLTKKSMALKATAFLNKPIHRDALEQALQKATDNLPSDP